MREQTPITREELNNAIFTVLKTQFKKEAPEAFKTVEQAGFKIEKYNGTFEVKADNFKSVQLMKWNSLQYRIYLRFSYNQNVQHNCFYYRNPCPIDFVGYFESPIKKRENPYYHNIGWGKWKDCSDAVASYYILIHNKQKAINSIKADIQRERERIASLQRQISNCMDNIERYYKDIAEHEKQLNDNRREFGLSKAN